MLVITGGYLENLHQQHPLERRRRTGVCAPEWIAAAGWMPNAARAGACLERLEGQMTCIRIYNIIFIINTVDGRNPAPLWMVESLEIMG